MKLILWYDNWLEITSLFFLLISLIFNPPLPLPLVLAPVFLLPSDSTILRFHPSSYSFLSSESDFIIPMFPPPPPPAGSPGLGSPGAAAGGGVRRRCGMNSVEINEGAWRYWLSWENTAERRNNSAPIDPCAAAASSPVLPPQDASIYASTSSKEDGVSPAAPPNPIQHPQLRLGNPEALNAPQTHRITTVSNIKQYIKPAHKYHKT